MSLPDRIQLRGSGAEMAETAVNNGLEYWPGMDISDPRVAASLLAGFLGCRDLKGRRRDFRMLRVDSVDDDGQLFVIESVDEDNEVVVAKPFRGQESQGYNIVSERGRKDNRFDTPGAYPIVDVHGDLHIWLDRVAD